VHFWLKQRHHLDPSMQTLHTGKNHGKISDFFWYLPPQKIVFFLKNIPFFLKKLKILGKIQKKIQKFSHDFSQCNEIQTKWISSDHCEEVITSECVVPCLFDISCTNTLLLFKCVLHVIFLNTDIVDCTFRCKYLS